MEGSFIAPVYGRRCRRDPCFAPRKKPQTVFLSLASVSFQSYRVSVSSAEYVRRRYPAHVIVRSSHACSVAFVSTTMTTNNERFFVCSSENFPESFFFFPFFFGPASSQNRVCGAPKSNTITTPIETEKLKTMIAGAFRSRELYFLDGQSFVLLLLLCTTQCYPFVPRTLWSSASSSSAFSLPTTELPGRTYQTELSWLKGTTQSTLGNIQIPFIIERIGKYPNEKTFEEIANLCINVFFKEQLHAGPDDRLAYVNLSPCDSWWFCWKGLVCSL